MYVYIYIYKLIYMNLYICIYIVTGGARHVRALGARHGADDPTVGLCIGPYDSPRGGSSFL